MRHKHTVQLHTHTEHLILLFKQLPHHCVNILTNQITNLALTVADRCQNLILQLGPGTKLTPGLTVSACWFCAWGLTVYLQDYLSEPSQIWTTWCIWRSGHSHDVVQTRGHESELPGKTVTVPPNLNFWMSSKIIHFSCSHRYQSDYFQTLARNSVKTTQMTRTAVYWKFECCT